MRKTLLCLSLFAGLFTNVHADISSLTVKNTVPDVEVNISTDLLCNILPDGKFGPDSARTTRDLDENPIQFGEEKIAVWKRCTLAKKGFFEGIENVSDHSKIQVSIKDLRSGDIYTKIIQVPELTQVFTLSFANKNLEIRLTHQGDYFSNTGDNSNIMLYSTNSQLEVTNL